MFRIPFARSALAVAALILVSAPAASADQPSPEVVKACVNGQRELKPLQPLSVTTDKGRFSFKVEDADTFARRETGLMCRASLAPDRGMLFDFKSPTDNVAFWMKDTLIPLDIVFIRPDGRVLSIARNARPLDTTPLPAGGRIRGVLEIAGGRAAQIGLMPGDKVSHRIFPR